MHSGRDSALWPTAVDARRDVWDRLLTASIVAALSLLLYLNASGRALDLLVPAGAHCAPCESLQNGAASEAQWQRMLCPRDPAGRAPLALLCRGLSAFPTATATAAQRALWAAPPWPYSPAISAPSRAPAAIDRDEAGYAAHPLLYLLARVAILWATLGTLLLAFRTLLWFRYRPYLPATLENAPPLTVIVPAYNEGAMVEMTIHSVAAASYPRERLEILVVDDGSKDDTWDYIQRAARVYPGLVTALRFASNRGKRAALEAGFRRARGDVVVTIDSDSVIEGDTLLAMAGPFADARIGAVAGQVAVYNGHQGLIPRMLSVRFVLAFDFLRAVQSVYRTVYCCPGALAAYRTAVVREVLAAWMNQTFLGAPCTFGEDRSLTNYILDRGYDSVYQRTGVVHTIVPRTYSRLCKMYLRWDRSYIREELRLCSIAWRRRPASRLITLVDIAITNLRYPVGYAVLGLVIVLSLHDPLVLVHFVAAIALVSALNMCYYLRCRRSWHAVYEVAYSYFSVFALFWVFPYALMTVRSRSWLTR